MSRRMIENRMIEKRMKDFRIVKDNKIPQLEQIEWQKKVIREENEDSKMKKIKLLIMEG